MYSDLVSTASDRSTAYYGLVQVCTHTLPLKHSVTQSTTFTIFHDGDRGSKKCGRENKEEEKRRDKEMRGRRRKREREGKRVQNSSHILTEKREGGKKEGGSR